MANPEFVQKLMQKMMERAENLAGSVLDSDVFNRTLRDIPEFGRRIESNSATLLGFLNLPTRADIDEVNEVLTRSRHKIRTLEVSLARCEAAVDRVFAGDGPAAGKREAKAVKAKPVKRTTDSLTSDLLSGTKAPARKRASTAKRKKKISEVAVKTRKVPMRPRRGQAAADVLLDIDLTRPSGKKAAAGRGR